MSRKKRGPRAQDRYKELLEKIGSDGEDHVAAVLESVIKDMGVLVKKLGLTLDETRFFLPMTMLECGTVGLTLSVPLDEIIEAVTKSYRHVEDMEDLEEAIIEAQSPIVAVTGRRPSPPRLPPQKRSARRPRR